ncbi:MAG TPA: peptidylprolyl isomerase [Chitinophagales bacterium]
MKKIAAIFFATSSLVATAQTDKNATVFTVANEPVAVGEFEYVYTKNNINNQADYSEKSLNDYLKLYENFRLKVKEAEALQLDTISSLKTELENYRKQLAKTYLTDREVNEQLIKEAYDRSLKEVNAAHILVRCDENANPADTLAAYKKALDIRSRLLKGEDFGKLAQELSADPSAKTNKGDIGFFTVFQTVYPFETAAYTTKIGEVSEPVRSQYGYHIVKALGERPAQGEIHTAHILKKADENAGDFQKTAAKKSIDSIYNLLSNNKISFDSAVVEFSDDRTSKNKGGELAWFGVGRMVPEFEKAAFWLQKNGEFSAPVKTAYGWHIIKRLEKKDIQPFNEAKAEFKKKVERDSRSQVAKSKLIERIKAENKFTENAANKKAFFAAVDSNLAKGWFKADSFKLKEATLFTLDTNKYSNTEFAAFIEKSAKRRTDKNKEQLLNEYYDNFANQKAIELEESQLDTKKPEFAHLMKEYRDGILLFELTDRKVWGYALKDTAGLDSFYQANKQKYLWPKRVDAEIFNCSNKKIAGQAYKLIKRGLPAGDVQLKLNTKYPNEKVSVISDKFEKKQYDIVDKTSWIIGTTKPVQLGEKSFQFVRINKVINAEPKTLKEAKGFVVSDYQEYLEKKWLDELRAKYPIAVNEPIFKSLIKK